jgi:shikimate kinase
LNPSTSSPLHARWVCLTGFMGAGKSTVGALLAELLGWRFVDLDTEIVKQEGRSIAEIFTTVGEPQFRHIESAVLQAYLRAEVAPAVIALGGGTFIQAGNRALLREHHAKTVYLEADFDFLQGRCCTEEGTRPLMQDPIKFRDLFQQRRPIYSLADLTVSTAGRSADVIAAEIATNLEPNHARAAVSD